MLRASSHPTKPKPRQGGRGRHGSQRFWLWLWLVLSFQKQGEGAGVVVLVCHTHTHTQAVDGATIYIVKNPQSPSYHGFCWFLRSRSRFSLTRSHKLIHTHTHVKNHDQGTSIWRFYNISTMRPQTTPICTQTPPGCYIMYKRTKPRC